MRPRVTSRWLQRLTTRVYVLGEERQCGRSDVVAVGQVVKVRGGSVVEDAERGIFARSTTLCGRPLILWAQVVGCRDGVDEELVSAVTMVVVVDGS